MHIACTFRTPGITMTAVSAIASAILAGCAAEEVPVEMVHEGRVYDLLDPGADTGPDIDVVSAGIMVPPEGLTHFGEFGPPLQEWPREELAEALRPAFMHRNGGTYVAREPDWAAADAILDGDDQERHVDVRIRPRGDAPDPIGRIVAAVTGVIGGDGRSLVPDTTVHPHSAIARVMLYTGGIYRGSCSGSYIGPWTFVTSAHCLVFSDSDRINRLIFQPARAGSSMPFGSFDCRLDDASMGNDFYWAVPAGYLIGQEHSLDYAVIDTYPCHYARSYFTGYAVNPNDETYTAHGYPGMTCPGASAAGVFQCGMSGPSYDDAWRLETEHIDQTAGQSGGPWYRRISSINRVVGVVWGYREYFDFGRCGFDVCRRNFARLFDNAVDTFIREHAFDY